MDRTAAAILGRAALILGLGLGLAADPRPVEEPPGLALLQAGGALCGTRRIERGPSFALLAAAAVAAPASAAGSVPLYPDLAGLPFPLTSSSPQARAWFSQGLMLTYGFNHAGAVASFRKAQAADPACALCWWGEAMALGPNINAPMDDRDRPAALAALDRAVALKAGASAMEQALITALETRYSRDPAADRAALDAAYADAMLGVAARFPDNDDVAVLAAEAAMDTSPWNYWAPDGRTPIGRSADAIRLVEAVLARNPGHPQAAHLYIHLMEASDPQRAAAAADRLGIAPIANAGHLVHMPAHIWHRTGSYSRSIAANIAAARSDEAFIAATGDRGLLRYGYYPHNVHFIVTSAQMAGDMDAAIREAARLRTILDIETSARIGWVQAIDAAPYFAMAQFATPAAILAQPAPDPRLPYAMAMFHYARAVAYAADRNAAGFAAELAALDAAGADPAVKALVEQGIPVPELVSLARAVALGRKAMADGRFEEAVAQFGTAAAIEAKLPYTEPAYWYFPVQQSLGAALLLAGDPKRASTAFRAALVQTPNNGWALWGLAESEAAAGRSAEAQVARTAFAHAWAGDPAWLRLERL